MTINVRQAALGFAEELQSLLDAVLPVPAAARQGDREVIVQTADHGRDVRYSIRVAEPRGWITLVHNALPVAYLRIWYLCTHDTAKSYLAVAKSEFELLSLRDRTPLARLDYLRNAHTVPAAHWNVYAERGAVSHVLASTNSTHAGVVSKLHFPVGGARMRPCLEDFLAFVLHEFRIDARAGARQILDDGRARWRRRQVGALVRDVPAEAVRVLRDLGYDITPPPGGDVAANEDALRAW